MVKSKGPSRRTFNTQTITHLPTSDSSPSKTRMRALYTDLTHLLKAGQTKRTAVRSRAPASTTYLLRCTKSSILVFQELSVYQVSTKLHQTTLSPHLLKSSQAAAKKINGMRTFAKIQTSASFYLSLRMKIEWIDLRSLSTLKMKSVASTIVLMHTWMTVGMELTLARDESSVSQLSLTLTVITPLSTLEPCQRNKSSLCIAIVIVA